MNRSILGERAALAAAALGLLGCTSSDGTTGEAASEIVSVNGLSMINGLSMLNGLSSTGMVGFGMSGGAMLLKPLNNGALAPNSALMTSTAGRITAAYLVRCALPLGHSLTQKDQTGASYTFLGQLGLAPEWETSSCAAGCQEYVSACLMAHVNTAGLHIPIWLDAASPNVGWGQSALFPKQEGSFFGNLFVNPPQAYYCDGDGFTGGATGVVAGRIGAGGANEPYVNPFGDGTLCKNTPSVVAYYGAGATEPDGYSQLTYHKPWNNVVTVWRASTYTAVFDPVYKYRFYALSTRANPMLINLTNSSTAAGTQLQQWPLSANLDSSQFSILLSGIYWKFVAKKDATKCLDAGAGTNGTVVTLQTCNGSPRQQWAFNTDGGYGSAFIQNVGSGRCLDATGKTQGLAMDVYDCGKGSWQEFWILAGT